MSRPRLRVLGRSGNAAIEFALLAPVLILLLGGMIDYGLDVYYRAQLQTAIRAGAQYATGTGRGSNYAAITAVVQGASQLSGIEVTEITTVCRCADKTTISCVGSTCADGSAVGVYLDLAGKYTYSPVLAMLLEGNRTLTYKLSFRTS